MSKAEGRQRAWSAKSLRREGPRYLALADRIADDIASGRLRPGTQLPAQRDLADTLGVDLTTVSRAYTEAARRGLVAGHVGRGTFVRAGLVARSGDAGLRETAELVDLSLSLPPRLTPDIAGDALASTLTEIARDFDLSRLLQYRQNAGDESHRVAGAMWIAARGVDAPADRVVITNGAQHALTVLLSTLAAPGDRVLTESLTYPGFRALAEQLHMEPVGLPLDDEGIRIDAFRKACRASRATVLYCTPTLHNPTAIVTSAARRRDLMKAAAEFGVAVIEDDVYGALASDAPSPLASMASANSYFVASLSKAVAPGLRIGYVLAPSAREADRISAAVRATTWMAPPLMAEIAASWIRDGTAHRILAANREAAVERQAIARRVLRAWQWRAHPRGYHGWLELPAPWTTAAFTTQARRAGVGVAPADAFAVSQQAIAPAVRVSVSAAADLPSLEIAMNRLARLLELGPGVSSQIL
ncbi:MAG: PLP-dependent aminotransferase family protein [Gemmatimonadota bacterium]|nr:PLP-dependent aminotransferase family protein [Gemmatimonadota bacterium]